MNQIHLFMPSIAFYGSENCRRRICFCGVTGRNRWAYRFCQAVAAKARKKKMQKQSRCTYFDDCYRSEPVRVRGRCILLVEDNELNSGMNSIDYNAISDQLTIIMVAFKEGWIHWNHWIFWSMSMTKISSNSVWFILKRAEYDRW